MIDITFENLCKEALKSTSSKITTQFFCSLLAFGALTFSGCKKEAPEPPINNPDVDFPIADFSFELNELSAQFTFTGSEAEEFSWNFGDGTTSNENNPKHRFSEFGTYSVSLSVTNANGQASFTDTITIDLTTLQRPPVLDLSSFDGVFTATNHQRKFINLGSSSLVKNGSANVWCAGPAGYASVGTVKFKQNNYTAELAKDDENFYWWDESIPEQTGFNKSGGPAWSITGGGPHGSVSGLANVFPFPGVKNILTTKSIPANENYTLVHDGGFSGADTVSFSIYGPAGSIMKWSAPSITEMVFTSAELASLGKGNCTLMIAAYHVYDQNLGSREYKVINQTVTVAFAELD